MAKDPRFLVINWKRIESALTKTERVILDALLDKINEYTDAKEKKYWVVNQDEPYANKIYEMIKEHEGDVDSQDKDKGLQNLCNTYTDCLQGALISKGLELDLNLDCAGKFHKFYAWKSRFGAGFIHEQVDRAVDSIMAAVAEHIVDTKQPITKFKLRPVEALTDKHFETDILYRCCVYFS